MVETQKPAAIRLLLVDDEPDFLQATSRALERRGFEVATAAEAACAIAILEKEPFDVAVLDVRMPGMDGVDLFRSIKKRWPGMKVLILTGHATIQQAFSSVREGVFEYLTKPCDVEKLAHVARMAVNVTKDDWAGGPTAENAQIRVLLVDDETELTEGLARILARRGMAVSTASAGLEGLEMLGSQGIDVMVLDVRMPGIDGLEVLRRARAAHPEVQVLLLTGHPTISNAFEGVRLGAHDYLLKPYDLDDLVAKIHAAFLKGREFRRSQNQANA